MKTIADFLTLIKNAPVNEPLYKKGYVLASKEDKSIKIEVQTILYDGFVFLRKTEKKYYFGFKGYHILNLTTMEYLDVTENYLTDGFEFDFDAFENERK